MIRVEESFLPAAAGDLTDVSYPTESRANFVAEKKCVRRCASRR